MVEKEERKLFFVNFYGTLALSMVSVLSFKGLFNLRDLAPIASIMIFGFIASCFRLSEKFHLMKYLRNALIVFVFIMGVKWIAFNKKDINFTLCEILLWTIAIFSSALSKDRDYIIMRWMAIVGVIVSSVFTGGLVNMRPFSIWMIGLAFFILIVLLRTDFVRERFKYLSFVCEEKEYKNVVGQLLIGGTFTSFCLVSTVLAYILMPRVEYVIYRAIPSYLPLAEDTDRPRNYLSWESGSDSNKSSGYLYIQPQELTAENAKPVHLKAFYLYGAKNSKKRTVTNLVEWFVKDPAIAGISENGVLKGKKPGITMVRCIYRTGNNTAVSEPVELFVGLGSIEVKPEFELMEEGKTQKISAEGTFEDGKKIDLTSNVIWELDENSRKKGLAFILNDGTLTSRKAGIVGIRARRGSDRGEQDVVKSPTAYVIITRPYGGLFKDGTGGGNETLFSSSHPGYWGITVYDKYNGTNWSVSCQTLSDLTRKANKFYTKQKFSKSADENKVLVNCIINSDMQGIVPLFGTRVEEIILPEISKNVLKADSNDNVYVVPEFVLPKGMSFQELAVPQDKNLPNLDFSILNFRSYSNFVLKNYTALPKDVSIAVKQKTEELLKERKTVREALDGIDDFIFNACVVGRVTEIPKDLKDITEYVLFSGKPCNMRNLATAQVVMYRLAGIPSRLIEGVASFSQNPKTGLYDIHAGSIAAWPQIYIKDTGWIDRFPYRLYQKTIADKKKIQEEVKKDPEPKKTDLEKTKILKSIDIKVIKFRQDAFYVGNRLKFSQYITWHISSPEAASISKNGVVVVKEGGHAVIKGVTEPQISKKDLQAILKTDPTAYAGDKLKFSKNMKWHIANPETASIDKDGMVTIKEGQQVVIKGVTEPQALNKDSRRSIDTELTLYIGNKLSFTPTKTANPQQISKGDLQDTKKGDLAAYVNDKMKFSLVKTFADGHTEEVDKDIRWYSSNPEVISIDKFGDVTVKEKGAAVIKGFISNKESFPLVVTSFAKAGRAPHNAFMKFIKKIMPALSAIALWFIGMYLFVVIKKRAIDHMIKFHPEKAIKIFYRQFVIKMRSANFAFNETATQLEISEIVLKNNPDLRAAVSIITSNYLETVFGGYKMSSVKAYESFDYLRKIEEYMRGKLTFIERVKSGFLFTIISLRKGMKE